MPDPKTPSKRRSGSHVQSQPSHTTSPQGPSGGDQGTLQQQAQTTLNSNKPPVPPKPSKGSKSAPPVPPKPRRLQQPPTPNQQTKEDENDPVSKALDAFARADKGVIEAAASAYIMRTDEGEKKLVGDEDSDNGITAKGKHESGAQATIFGRAEVVELEDAYAVLVDAGVIVGASIKLEGELAGRYGKLAGKLKGNLEAFVGAAARVTGRAQIGAEGISLQGKATAFAGVKGKGKAAVEFSYGELGLGGEGELEGKAGAWAEADGELSFSKESIAVSGSAKAFAGVEGSVKGTGKAKLYGRDAFTVSGKATGALGAGGSASGGFKIRGGKIQFKVGAKGALGLGVGGKVDMAADLKPVAVWTWRQVDKAKWNYFKKDEGNNLLDNPETFRKPLRKKLDKYAKDKVDALHLGKAENFVKIEKVQQYVGEKLPRKKVQGHRNAQTIDRVIKECIDESLNAACETTDISAVVTNGKVEKIEHLPEPGQLKAKFKTKSKTGKALDSITTGFS